MTEETSLRVTAHPSGVRVALRVMPRSPIDEIAGIRDGRIVVRVTAPPEGGEANDAVLRTLARELHVPPSHIRVVTGAASRNKIVEIALTETIFRQRIRARFPGNDAVAD